jgi:7SK snRNA methylphosphate capping enzyme
MDSIINGKTENQKVHTITNVNKKKQKKYHQKLYGNYDNYYFKRYGAENSSDIRVELLKKHSEYFNGKRILDIGCNSGFVTIEMAKQFQTSSILGIDIDENLIEKARKNLNRIKNDSMLNEDEKKSLSNIIFRKVGLSLSH